MSKEIAKAFINRLETDKVFQQKIVMLGEVEMFRLLEFARTEGYHFTEEDWNLAYLGNPQEELNETELDIVSGGLNPQPLPPRYIGDLHRPNPLPNAGIIVIGGKTIH